MTPPPVASPELRVALVTDTYAPATNGVVRSVRTTRDALQARGIECRVLAPATRSLAARLREPGVRFFPAMETNLYPGLHLSVLPLRRRHLGDVDVVHVHTPGPLGLAALAAARRLGKPAVFTYHTRFDQVARHFAPAPVLERAMLRGLDRLDRIISRSTAAVVAPSAAVSRELRDALGIDAPVVPTGVDVARFAPHPPSDPRVAALRQGAGPVFVHVGRLSPEKGIDRVIRAFGLVRGHLPDARLIIGGKGPDEARLRELTRSLQLEHSVRFLGFVAESDLAATYAAGDAYVTGSEFETQGLTVLEAMACGTPVVAPDVPVFDEAFASGGARAFAADDVEDAARALRSAVDDARAMRAHAIAFARAHSTDACARRLADLYARVATNRAPPVRKWHGVESVA